MQRRGCKRAACREPGRGSARGAWRAIDAPHTIQRRVPRCAVGGANARRGWAWKMKGSALPVASAAAVGARGRPGVRAPRCQLRAPAASAVAAALGQRSAGVTLAFRARPVAGRGRRDVCVGKLMIWVQFVKRLTRRTWSFRIIIHRQKWAMSVHRHRHKQRVSITVRAPFFEHQLGGEGAFERRTKVGYPG